MSCPVHIWIPLMGAAVPVARVVRDRVTTARSRLRAQREAKPAPTIKRWAPVGATSAAREDERPTRPAQPRPAPDTVRR